MSLTRGDGTVAVEAVAAAGLLLLCSVPSLAQGPPINTDTAFVHGLNGAAVRTFFLASGRKGLRVDGQQANDPLDRALEVRGQLFVLPYELLPNRLVVMAVAPYLHKTLMDGPADARRRRTSTGFGDLAVAAKLNLYQRDGPGRTTRAAFYGRVKLPTGATDATGTDGRALPRPLQLGTGSVDYTSGAIVTHNSGRLGLHGDVLIDLNTTAGGFAAGDRLRYDLALGYRAWPPVYRSYPARQVNVYLELNGTATARDRLDGVTQLDAGGHWLFLAPGIQFAPAGGFLVELTYQWPVWQRLNGSQLAVQSTVKAGIRWLLG